MTGRLITTRLLGTTTIRQGGRLRLCARRVLKAGAPGFMGLQIGREDCVGLYRRQLYGQSHTSQR